MKRFALCLLSAFAISSALFVPQSFASEEESFLRMLEYRQRQNLQIIEARRQNYCRTIGGVWDDARQVCHLSLDAERTCGLMGGKWSDGLCHFPGECLNVN